MQIRLSVARICAAGAGVALACMVGPGLADDIVPVDQGWSVTQKATWYTLSQGSRLIPLAWLQALEQPGPSVASADHLFLDRAHIAKYRYLPNDSAGVGLLPIGFAIDTQDDSQFSTTMLRWKKPQSSREAWVGFNCAACHTAEISFQGKRMRIEGGPTLADFEGFFSAFNLALIETRDNADKFDRFARGVLKGADSASNRAMLKGELDRLIRWQLSIDTANKTPLEPGFARLDAFGHIFNKILLRLQADPQVTNPSDAPVSYPFLWNIHQHDKVQWNGIAPNIPISPTLDVGALGRNVGEVIGVFADLRLISILPPSGPAINGYPSSAQAASLIRLEQMVASLKPPPWPDVFPPIDPDKWEAGKKLFERTPDGCAECHQVLPRSDLQTRFKVKMTPLIGPRRIGTDPWMACNAYTYQARSGLLELTPKKFFALSSPPIRDTESVATMLGSAVTGILWNNKSELLKSIKSENLAGILQSANLFELNRGFAVLDSSALIAELFPTDQPGDKRARLQRCLEEAADILAYKGRPLTGIWATAPYLHNGSVPTLFDLLLPPKDRPSSFSLGTREFDPEKVGYVTDRSKFETDATKAENAFVFRTKDANGPISGNLNSGHDYGNASFTDADRMALVEYMKAVGAVRVGDRIVP